MAINTNLQETLDLSWGLTSANIEQISSWVEANNLTDAEQNSLGSIIGTAFTDNLEIPQSIYGENNPRIFVLTDAEIEVIYKQKSDAWEVLLGINQDIMATNNKWCMEVALSKNSFTPYIIMHKNNDGVYTSQNISRLYYSNNDNNLIAILVQLRNNDSITFTNNNIYTYLPEITDVYGNPAGWGIYNDGELIPVRSGQIITSQDIGLGILDIYPRQLPPPKLPKKFSMQQVFEVLLQRPIDNSTIAYLTDTKVSSLENTVEMTYPTGSTGNVYIGGGFSHSRRARVNFSLATWNIDTMASQNGTVVNHETQNAVYYDTIKIDDSGQVMTKYTAIGASNAEIGYVYKLNDDGTVNSIFTQYNNNTRALTPPVPSGKFIYTPSSKRILFNENEQPEVGDYYSCVYEFKPSATSQLSVKSDAIPDMAIATLYGLARDVCSGELYPAQIKGRVQIDGNWTLDLSADGDPAVHDLNMEFVKGCLDNDLYTFTIYTDGTTHKDE